MFLRTKSAFLCAPSPTKKINVKKVIEIVISFHFWSKKLEKSQQYSPYHSEIDTLEYPTLF